MNISKLVATNAVKACFPFHDEQRRNTLSEGWIKMYARPGAQPLQDIKASGRYGVSLGEVSSYERPFPA